MPEPNDLRATSPDGASLNLSFASGESPNVSTVQGQHELTVEEISELRFKIRETRAKLNEFDKVERAKNPQTNEQPP